MSDLTSLNATPVQIGWTQCDVQLGPILARYRHDPETGRVDLVMLPSASILRLVERRPVVTGIDVDAYSAATGTLPQAEKLDSLVQIKELKDAQPAGFAQGSTLRNSGTVERLRLIRFEEKRTERQTLIRSTLLHADGWQVVHELIWLPNCDWVTSRVRVDNSGGKTIQLEMLASFSLAGITPFANNDAPGRLQLHRFRSAWCREGHLETRPTEDYQLERSWGGWGVRCERYGSVGSMPVHNFFPFVGVEDTGAQVTWAARLACPGSWQMEVYRRDDGLALSGGLADRSMGHWVKALQPGESFSSPTAFLTCVEGGIDEACDALTKAVSHFSKKTQSREQGLPIIANEWATSWGRPTHEAMQALAKRLRDSGVRYLIIDAGWYAPEKVAWGKAHGDWLPSAQHYPEGLKATADAIRSEGLVPGLWFEMETCGVDSRVYSEHMDWLLCRDGQPITVGARRFLDFRKPEVIDYLSERVIGLLRDCNFGYMKVDYNDTLGIGVDGAESYGEGLREHLAAVQAFFQRIRDQLPDLVIENCSSGGHRLEPSFFALTEMSSFSDAHESPEIPIIAANLNRLVPLIQSQIWVVLRTNEDRQRTIYSMAAGFLGRCCFSGDLANLNPTQTELLPHMVALYQKSEPILQSGISRRYGSQISSYRHPEGWQVVLRAGTDGQKLLLVAHRFGGSAPKNIEIPLPPGRWETTDCLDEAAPPSLIQNGILKIALPEAWQAQVLHLAQARPMGGGQTAA